MNLRHRQKVAKVFFALMTALVLTSANATGAGERYFADGDFVDMTVEVTTGRARAYVAKKPTNEPLVGAKIELKAESGSEALSFAEVGDGLYEAKLQFEVLPKGQMIVSLGDESDILDMVLDVSNPQSAEGEGSALAPEKTNAVWFATIGALVAGIAIGIAGAMFFRRSSAMSLLLAVTLPLLMMIEERGFAHEGHDDAPSVEEAATGSAVNLKKQSQFLLGVRTVPAVVAPVADGIVSYGHVVAKPQLDAPVTAPQTGSISGSQRLQLGQPIRKGQVLATIESVGEIPVRSPIDGQLLEISAVEGSRVDAGAKLFRITDTSTVWVDAELYESDLAKLKAGVESAVTIEGLSQTFEAKMLNFTGAISEETRTAKVILELNNKKNEIRIGSFASIHFAFDAKRDAISLPKSAVLNRGGDQVVFVQTGPETFEARNVLLEESSVANTVIIIHGVSEGDRVVVTGNYQLLLKAK